MAERYYLALPLAREEPPVTQRLKGSHEIAILAQEAGELPAIVGHDGAQNGHSVTLARRRAGHSHAS